MERVLFWAGRRRQLEAIVKKYWPWAFVYAADLNWDDLMRHLPNYQEWKQGTAAERIRYSRENLRNNPHIVAQWFNYLLLNYAIKHADLLRWAIDKACLFSTINMPMKCYISKNF